MSIKWYEPGEEPIPQQVFSIKQAFEIHSLSKRMENEITAKAMRDKYLSEVAEKGDVHWIKKTTFGPSYPKMTLKGEFTPQALFDADPAGYIKEFMDEADFVYLGLEFKALRRGDNKSWYHKICVKEKPILESLSQYLLQDPNYVPRPGCLINYAKFNSYVCKNNGIKKKNMETEKKKKTLAKVHSIDEINAMEKKEISLLDEECDKEMAELLKQRSDVETQIGNVCATSEEQDSYRKVKELIDQKFSDVNNKRISKKCLIASFYADIRKMRDVIEVEKAATIVERNNKRRVKRFEEKQTRLRVDNALGVISDITVVPTPPVTTPPVTSLADSSLEAQFPNDSIVVELPIGNNSTPTLLDLRENEEMNEVSRTLSV